MNNIELFLKKSKEIEKNYLEMLKQDVIYIKENNINNISFIERTLDNIMSICFFDTHRLFFELCNYYDDINLENSNEYRLIYMDMHKND